MQSVLIMVKVVCFIPTSDKAYAAQLDAKNNLT
jgi:hypothetical protein